jgi:hypothetical protein
MDVSVLNDVSDGGCDDSTTGGRRTAIGLFVRTNGAALGDPSSKINIAHLGILCYFAKQQRSGP